LKAHTAKIKENSGRYMHGKGHLHVVDDEQDVLSLLEYHFSREGFRVTCSSTGEDALESIIKDPPNLIILDIMLPGINGLEVLKRVQSNQTTRNIPVLFLSARADETDIILGLELGACDYVTKPFSLRVLISRIKVILEKQNHRGHATLKHEVIKIKDLEIFPEKQNVTCLGEMIKLTHAEFKILELLARKPGWVFSRTSIMECFHDKRSIVTERCIDVHIYSLRKKLGSGKDYIETVHHAGYRLIS
jgi:two-component system, OmpR family, alkaline phosphatase synthesis response regulator PhoP